MKSGRRGNLVGMGCPFPHHTDCFAFRLRLPRSCVRGKRRRKAKQGQLNLTCNLKTLKLTIGVRRCRYMNMFAAIVSPSLSYYALSASLTRGLPVLNASKRLNGYYLFSLVSQWMSVG